VQRLQPPRAPSPTKPMAERPAIEGLEVEPPVAMGSPWETRSPRSPTPQARSRSVSPTRSPHPLSPPRGRLEPMAYRPERSFVQVDFVGRRTPQGLHRGLARVGGSGSPTPQRQRGGVRGASKTLRPDLACVVPAATPLRRPSTGYYKS